MKRIMKAAAFGIGVTSLIMATHIAYELIPDPFNESLSIAIPIGAVVATVIYWIVSDT